MSIFYQQSGQRGEADFRKTLATSRGELRFFSLADVKRDYDFEASGELQGRLAGKQFQIWGVPTGARPILSKVRRGDLMLLVGLLSRKGLEYGRFFYAGRVVYMLPSEDFVFSRKLWGDGGFPLIFFMQGCLVDYSWLEFVRNFGFAPNYWVAGHTMRVGERRIAESPYHNEERFAQRLGIPAKE